MSKPSTNNLSLVDFMKMKRRENCPVCQLTDEVRAQLAVAADKKIKVVDQLEWVHTVIGKTLTRDQLVVHRNGRHDDD